MLTYQDFLTAKEKGKIESFINNAISEHKTSDSVKIAFDADAYDHRQNITIGQFMQMMYTMDGRKVEDFTASNLRVSSNFFNRLNTQRTSYSLGNGVSFTEEGTKEKLGVDFDTVLKRAGRYALIHGVSFIFFNLDHCHCFKLTEFVPLYDENTGVLMAGIRYYQLRTEKPLTAVLYEIDGYTKYRSVRGGKLEELEQKRAYKQIIREVPADEEPEVIGEENYSGLPIVPLWGSDLKQSTLIGMREQIDSYDLIRSGFANDLQDCAQIYWLMSGAMGMTDKDLQRFRDRLKLDHIALADTDNGAITPYTQDVPYQARSAYLEQIKKQIYEDFGGLDVADFSSGNKTATEIQAAYQPIDDQADDFEYQIIDCVQQILSLIGIEDTPIFKRNKITNQLEQVQLVMAEAEYLDDETILNKLPNITVDEVENILSKRDSQEARRMVNYQGNEEQEEEQNV